jgi:hypothetical protein
MRISRQLSGEVRVHNSLAKKLAAERDHLQILNFWWHWWNNRNKLREDELSVTAEELLRRFVS